ncbi:MAG: hypothetical protein EZS28_008754 [Streblomastix strix]|uniref:Poly(A) polymerase RNA-binding domain-containing protein n=1 Tax=Streblomastix strix TaxID=222440 RepID=A0A5J4WLN0_9EUKA|nr:MAG: hypothetical protein EZS28_008754 [Streblomastix strix]
MYCQVRLLSNSFEYSVNGIGILNITTPFFSNYETFIRIDFSSEFEQDLKKWMGFGESKLRSLTIYLESLPNVDVACPLPHPFLHSKKKKWSIDDDDDDEDNYSNMIPVV